MKADVHMLHMCLCVRVHVRVFACACVLHAPFLIVRPSKIPNHGTRDQAAQDASARPTLSLQLKRASQNRRINQKAVLDVALAGQKIGERGVVGCRCDGGGRPKRGTALALWWGRLRWRPMPWWRRLRCQTGGHHVTELHVAFGYP